MAIVSDFVMLESLAAKDLLEQKENVIRFLKRLQ